MGEHFISWQTLQVTLTLRTKSMEFTRWSPIGSQVSLVGPVPENIPLSNVGQTFLKPTLAFHALLVRVRNCLDQLTLRAFMGKAVCVRVPVLVCTCVYVCSWWGVWGKGAVADNPGTHQCSDSSSHYYLWLFFSRTHWRSLMNITHSSKPLEQGSQPPGSNAWWFEMKPM